MGPLPLPLVGVVAKTPQRQKGGQSALYGLRRLRCLPPCSARGPMMTAEYKGLPLLWQTLTEGCWGSLRPRRAGLRERI